MEKEIDIVLEHGEPVSMDAVRQMIDVLTTTIERSSIAFLYSEPVRRLGLTEEQLQIAESLIRDMSRDSIWLESVEKGSSVFKSRIMGLVFSALAIVAGNYAVDTLQNSEEYRTFVERSGEYFDGFVGDVRQRLERRGQVPQPDRVSFDKWAIVSDRIRITFRPTRRQSDLARLRK